MAQLNKTKVTSVTTTGYAIANIDTTDVYDISALDRALVIGAPTGTPYEGQALVFRIRDNGVKPGFPLAFNSIFVSRGVPFPIATMPGCVIRIAFLYSSEVPTWDLISVAQEAYKG